jgi:hypothetical protein
MTKQSHLLDAICWFMATAVLIFGAIAVQPAGAQNQAQPRTAPQLEQLVAPIALYPDALLSQILMASTYPLEVVAAARWSQANPGVTGQSLEDAMQKQSWDPSVKALTAVPQTLQMMSDKLDWTRDLGDAFLAQQANVLDAVQRLRQRADNAGNLKTTEQQKVIKTAPPAGTAPQSSSAPADVYTIESANPDEYYVPIYDPGVVYGAWPYPEYAPFYWYPPGYVGRGVLAFATGIAAGAAIWAGIDWWRRRVDINVSRYNSFNRTRIASRNWTHNPAHRGAVLYRDRNVAQRFGNPGHAAAREAFRDRANAGRQQIAPREAGKLGQKGAASRMAAAGAGAAGAKAAAKRAGTAGPRHAARPGQGARSPQVSHHRGAPRHAAARGHVGAPRHAAARGHVSAPRMHASRGVARGGGRAMARAGGGGRGGRRSDLRLKHDIALLGHLDSGIGLYRFAYNGSDKAYVGVIAQEVQLIRPEAVVRGRDGYLRVFYDKLGLKLQTYQRWIGAGSPIPGGTKP